MKLLDKRSAGKSHAAFDVADGINYLITALLFDLETILKILTQGANTYSLNIFKKEIYSKHLDFNCNLLISFI